MLNFFKTSILPWVGVQLILKTVSKWQRDDCLEIGAALAYYALFSLFPICLVILSVLGLVLGPETNPYQELLTLAHNILPAQSHAMVEEVLLAFNSGSIGAGLIGFGLLLLTASKIFEALGRNVQKIWQPTRLSPLPTNVHQKIIQGIREKLFAFLLVLSSVLVILLSMLSSLAVTLVLSLLNHFQNLMSLYSIPWWGLSIDNLLVIRGVQSSVSYFLLTAVIMGLFKILPGTRLYWSDIWPGAFLTTTLLMGLQTAVGLGMISLGAKFQTYGVIGNVMVLLLWIYLTFQIFFLGCEFTVVYTYLLGSRRQQPFPFSVEP